MGKKPPLCTWKIIRETEIGRTYREASRKERNLWGEERMPSIENMEESLECSDDRDFMSLEYEILQGRENKETKQNKPPMVVTGAGETA